MASTSQSHYYYDPNAYTWVQPTIIEDDDLTFGGKSLSTWYEEERRRLSSGSGSEDGEERRGRERVRKHYSRSSKSHKN